jgi:2,3-bisphosphoglycerate-dependent phosphoglycerate mutase
MIVSGSIYRSNRKYFRDYSRQVYTVVMLRHGESLWNQEKRFTGWSDVPLTEAGEADAKDAGMLIGERNIKFDVAFTSNLERAWRTCAIALAASKQSSVEVVRSWRLNERHYGGKALNPTFLNNIHLNL